MSYFLFGVLTPDQVGNARRLIDRAPVHGIHVRVREDRLEQPDLDQQRALDDMFAEMKIDNPATVKFLIVNEPTNNVSQELLEPYSAETPGHLGKVQAWLIDAFSSMPNIHVTLCISNGYAGRFRELTIERSELQQRLYDVLRSEIEWPPLRINVV